MVRNHAKVLPKIHLHFTTREKISLFWPKIPSKQVFWKVHWGEQQAVGKFSSKNIYIFRQLKWDYFQFLFCQFKNWPTCHKCSLCNQFAWINFGLCWDLCRVDLWKMWKKAAAAANFAARFEFLTRVLHIQEVFFPTPVPIWHILSVTFSGVIPWVHSWQLEDTELKK